MPGAVLTCRALSIGSRKPGVLVVERTGNAIFLPDDQLVENRHLSACRGWWRCCIVLTNYGGLHASCSPSHPQMQIPVSWEIAEGLSGLAVSGPLQASLAFGQESPVFDPCFYSPALTLLLALVFLLSDKCCVDREWALRASTW